MEDFATLRLDNDSQLQIGLAAHVALGLVADAAYREPLVVSCCHFVPLFAVHVSTIVAFAGLVHWDFPGSERN